jgi:hypothetical protein
MKLTRDILASLLLVVAIAAIVVLSLDLHKTNYNAALLAWNSSAVAYEARGAIKPTLSQAASAMTGIQQSVSTLTVALVSDSDRLTREMYRDAAIVGGMAGELEKTSREQRAILEQNTPQLFADLHSVLGQSTNVLNSSNVLINDADATLHSQKFNEFAAGMAQTSTAVGDMTFKLDKWIAARNQQYMGRYQKLHSIWTFGKALSGMSEPAYYTRGVLGK